jgi:gliding motility-associated-like protein
MKQLFPKNLVLKKTTKQMKTLFTLLLGFIFLCIIKVEGQGIYEQGRLYAKTTYPISYDSPTSNHILQNEIQVLNISRIERLTENETYQELLDIYVLTVDPGKEDFIIESLEKTNLFQYVERVPTNQLFYTPNDIHPNQYNLTTIQAEDAWDIEKGSASVTIAITDDAMLLNHEDFQGKIWVNAGEIPGNGIDDDGNGYIDDVNGWDAADNDNDPNPPASASTGYFSHGTHVAGIAGAATDNAKGVASIGFNVKLMPVKIGANSNSSLSGAYAGVLYAIDNNVEIINMSWGGPGASQTNQAIIDQAYANGIVCIAAAGNSNVSTPMYPAAYNHVIAVGATQQGDAKASFSNYGSYVDVMAPGDGIYSLVAGAGGVNNAYDTKSGTSMASPLTAGLAALMLSKNPALSPDDVEACLKSSCDNIDAQNAAYLGQLGAGRINAFEALSCIKVISSKFEADYTTQCPNTPIQFTDLSSNNPTTWEWTFPGGTPATSFSQNPSVSYAATGTYDVELIVTNANGSDTLNRTNYITIANPSATLSGSGTVPQGFTGNITVNLTGNPPWSLTYTDGISNYVVNNINSSPYFIQVSPADTTVYSLINVNDNFCGGSVQGTSTINVVPAGTSISSVCQFSNLYGDADMNQFGKTIFDPINGCFYAVGRNSMTNNTAILAKIDLTGSLVWQQEYPGTNYLSHVEIAPNGDLMLFRSQTINGSSNNYEFVVHRVDNNGTLLWSRNYSTSTRELSTRFVHLGNDEYVITSMHLMSGSGDDALFLKIDGSGNILTTNTYHGTDDQMYDMISNGSGGLIMIGGLHGGGHQDNIILELDGGGNIINSAEFEGTASNFTEGYVIRKTKDGGYITMNKYFTNSGSNHDLTLMKLDGQLNIEWSQTIVQSMSTQQAWNIGAWDIAQDNYGSYYASTRKLKQGSLVARISKFDSLGNYTWTKEFPDFSTMSIKSMNTLPDDNLMLWSTTDQVAGGFGDNDAFFAVLDTSLNSCLATPSGETVYTTTHIKKAWAPTPGTDTYTNNSNNIVNTPVSWSDYYACQQPCNICDLHAEFDALVGCPSDTVIFSDLSVDSTGIDSVIMWLWAFGDGDTVLGLPNPKHLYQATGTYTVTLIVGNSAIPMCLDTIQKTIVINTALKLDLRNDTSVCLGDSVKLNLTELCGQAPFTYNWSPSAGLSSTNVQSPVTAPATTTQYFVTVTDASGQTAVDSITVTIDQACCRSYADFISNSYFCFGELLKAGDNSVVNGSNPQYEWDFGPIAVPSNFNGSNPPNVSISTTGSYDVRLILNDGCGSDTIIKTIAVFPLPEIDLGNDTSICIGDTVFFEGSNLAQYLYQWKPVNLFDNANAFPNYTYPSANAQIIIEVTDKDVGCVSGDTMNIEIFDNDLFIGADTTICKGDSLFILPSSNTPISTYLWDNGSTQSAVYLTKGLHWLEAEALNGCVETDSMEISLDSIPDISLGEDSTLCLGETIQLFIEDDQVINYFWQGGASRNNFFVVSTEGDYSLMAEYYCGFAYDSISIDVQDCECRFYVPNSFTPDGDGINDIFMPKYSCSISDYSMKIYDRWGDLISESLSIDDGWDGTKAGAPVQAGVYIYDIIYTGESYRNINLVNRKGHITLIR